MSTLLTLAGMLGRGGSATERTRGRLNAVGAALATCFLFGAANMLVVHGRYGEVLGPFGQPGTRGGSAFAIALLVLPVLAFLYQSGRLATADRERRLAALRLAGATPREVRLLGALETTRSAALGTVVGAAGYLGLQWIGRKLLVSPSSGADADVPPLLCIAAMALVIGASMVSGLLAGRHVVATPLGVTRRASRHRPRAYGLAVVGVGIVSVYVGFFSDTATTLPGWLMNLTILGGGLIAVIGIGLSTSWLVWFAARAVGRRARSAETLLATRAIEADPRPWGRTLSVATLAVAVGTTVAWYEAAAASLPDGLETFWLSSFVLLQLALLVALSVTTAALIVRQAEYLLEQGPVLATLAAGGVSRRQMQRVSTRQAVIAATPTCAFGALVGLIAPGAPFGLSTSFLVWVPARGVLMAGVGVLVAVLASRLCRRRLRDAITPERLRTE